MNGEFDGNEVGGRSEEGGGSRRGGIFFWIGHGREET